MKRLVLTFIIVLLFSMVSTIAASSYTNVSVGEAKTMIDSNPSLGVLDVRTQSEYDSGHIRNTQHIPLTELGGRLDELNVNDEFLVYCASGGRSASASQLLVDNGFLHIYNMLGGITAWISAGYPVYVKYSSMQEAINNASPGDTILVSSGTYYEHIVVNKTLTLQGENRDTTIIDGEYLLASVVNVTANNVKFSSFTIQHCSGGGRALWLDNYGNMTFSHNIITGCNEGVRLHRSSGNVVSDNIVQDCYYNTGVGIDYGIDNTVYRNTIIHNHYGLSGGIDCHGNTFSENTIINNDVGFGTTSYDNNFFYNNFVNNSVHVIASGMNQFDDGYHSEGNYWSDYNGTDADGDGIGDTPYVVDTNNTDNYPLMNLYWNSGDIDHDLDVDIFDVVKCAIAYGSTPLDVNWNPHCDIAEPYGIINIFDLVTMAASYGEEYTP